MFGEVLRRAPGHVEASFKLGNLHKDAGRLDDAIAAVEIKLSDEELKLLQAPYRPHAVLGHSYGDAAELMARARRA